MPEKYLIMDVPGLDDDTNLDGLQRCSELRVRLARDFGLIPRTAGALTYLVLSSWGLWFSVVQHNPSALLLFPGNGANIVRRYLPKGWLNGVRWRSVQIKRIWEPGQQPYIIGGKFTNRLLPGTRTVIIIDDVISSGATIRKIQEENDAWLPNADWYAVAWLKQASACTRGFKGVYSGAHEVGTSQTKAPINSLSTLLDDQGIAESYARRNFGDKADEFLKLLKELRNSR